MQMGPLAHCERYDGEDCARTGGSVWPAQKLIGFIKDTCKPRFHWAKGGWLKS